MRNKLDSDDNYSKISFSCFVSSGSGEGVTSGWEIGEKRCHTCCSTTFSPHHGFNRIFEQLLLCVNGKLSQF